ncbi:MAG: LamG domain-containing protein [Planctomycetes bacterium]|nr:LamG domain-containing protein [Planctomycetota bacterium]
MTSQCLPTLVFCFLVIMAAAEGQTPAPLVELRFDEGFVNSGTLGGPATVQVYAEGEGPYLTPGPWGDCLDLTAASRFGGTIEQKNPAGSAVLVSNPALNSPPYGGFTVTLWLKAATDQTDTASRLLTKSAAWDLLYGNGRPSFIARKGADFQGYHSGDPSVARPGVWAFFAATVDATKNVICLYSGNRDVGLGAGGSHEMAYPPSPSDSSLEIGNFLGIRPFKGCLDNVRLYDVALTPEQVKQVFERDVANWSKGQPVSSLAQTPVVTRRFQPKQSAIFFSSRWQKKEAFDMLRAFRVTHLLWVYGSKPDYIKDVHDMGISYEGTLNGLCGFQKATKDRSAEGDATGRQRDLDGNKVVLPHMAKWKWLPWTGCPNNPDFRKLFWDEAAQLLAAGADSIMVDDWEMSAGTARGGLSCFCPSCMTGFREYLKRKGNEGELGELRGEDLATFDYREFLRTKLGIQNAEQYRAKFRSLPLTPHFLAFQREGVRDFYKEFRKHLDALSPQKYIPLSINFQFYWFTLEGACYMDLFDFLDGEASKAMQSAADYIYPCKAAEAFGMPQIMQTKPLSLGAPRAALATSYALGQWFLVPWDLYMDNDPATGQPAPRYFGKVEDWGAFYDFIHEHPHLFDGYQPAALVGVLFNADTVQSSLVRQACQRLAESQIPFRLMAAASKFSRFPVSADALKSVRYVLNLSGEDEYCDEDRRTIGAARDAGRVRFFKPTDDLESLFRGASLPSLRVEGPKNIYAFLRVKPDAAVIHVVNWNVLPDGSAADPFGHVTISLSPPESWGQPLRARYYQPGQKGGLDLQPEAHRDFLRLTLPRLETWGIVEIRPQ